MAPGKAKFLAAFFLSLFAFMATTNAIDFAELGKLFKTNQANSCIQTSSSPMHWIALSWLTLMMGVFFMSAAMILSGAFSIQKYSDYIKGGLWGIFETAGLLSIFTLAFAGLWEYGIRNIDTARAYSSVIRNTLSFDFGMVIVGTTIFSFMSRQSPQIRIPGFQAFGLSFQLSPMFRPIFDGLGMMVQLLAGAVAAWTANEFLLCFIKTDMLILLMPLGFFLRAFGIKAGGNALLGMALSLFFIYPFMIIAVGQMVSDYYVNEMLAASTPHIWPACLSGKPICCAPTDAVPSSWDEPFLPNGNNWRSDLSHRISQERVILGNVILSLHGVFQGGSICVFNTGLARTYGTFLSVVQSWGLPTFAGLAGGVAGLNFLFAKYVGLSWITVVLLPVMAVFMFSSMYEIVFFVFVVSILLPILILFVCLTAAKEITKALGTEIDLSALEKLI
ncbi:MAG: hypothetical protein N3F07_03255 [Candidatus Micrarchaeota archaeon]|nr:hypothetical protein [Candidatus Micrarchaeota archaeon]